MVLYRRLLFGDEAGEASGNTTNEGENCSGHPVASEGPGSAFGIKAVSSSEIHRCEEEHNASGDKKKSRDKGNRNEAGDLFLLRLKAEQSSAAAAESANDTKDPSS